MTETISQRAETVNNARPLCLATTARGRGPRGHLPGLLWKDCERIKGRSGEVMSALKMSPLGPPSQALGLATLKSKTRHTRTHTGQSHTAHAG